MEIFNVKKKVLVFGTFDGLHEGHLSLFEQAKKYGDFLIVVVARDVMVKRTKKRLPDLKEKERLKRVQLCGLVNEAVLGGKSNPYEIIKKIDPNIICLGYDQKFFVKDLKEKLQEMNLIPKIYRLKSYLPETFHSSLIKQLKNNERINSFNQ